jgi:hypothetical protein
MNNAREIPRAAEADTTTSAAGTDTTVCAESSISLVGRMKTRHEMIYEARYAVRLTQRTARLYRRIQSFGTFLAVLGGSGAASLLAASVPNWVGAVGVAVLAVSGAALVAIRPADKAAQNEADFKRYMALLAKEPGMLDEALKAGLAEAHQSDCPEIESLRDVAYNDVVAEFGRDDQRIKLKAHQRLLAALA